MSYKHIVVTFLLVAILFSLTFATNISPSSLENNSKDDIDEQWRYDVNSCVIWIADATLNFNSEDENAWENLESKCEKEYNCKYYKKDC